ncbi:GDSL-type esterase/lipase family protein [Kibdelosporangium persicum]|uniref:Lysophospholipase L1 n=1 Tax=Kibdelosporangium persicum TaxID=2698649 RepID=A0ABX2F8H7_9PSEU|nr:GDSL-type esterase/lipase family protein [Kibdelosporangium persicum]NRN67110.1 Lysophospholipase L1 [Kibdelosporangium persicum]
MSDVLLFGDSMVARLRKPHVQLLERELGAGCTVFTCATGGFDSSDGLARAPALGRLDWSVVVLSFGANDCAPWKHVPLDQFAANITGIVEAFAGARAVGFLPPTIREAVTSENGVRTNRELDAYREVLRSAVGPGGCLETGAHIGTDGLADDGLHLTSDSYMRLIPELARVISGR